MNKKDIKLILIILSVSILLLIPLKLIKKNNSSTATVYRKNKIILKIDLNINKEYSVDGKNGVVKIKVLNKKIKVIEETSPLHICSKQGYISNKYESIICLPNEITITIGDNELDTIVR